MTAVQKERLKGHVLAAGKFVRRAKVEGNLSPAEEAILDSLDEMGIVLAALVEELEEKP